MARSPAGLRLVRLVRPVRLVLLATLLAGVPACFKASFRDLTQAGPASPPASRCGECHVEIYKEWKESAHAMSWTRPAFRNATSRHRIEVCLGCHAARSVFEKGDPTLRANRRTDGVACITCHFHEGKLAGPAPKSALIDPHPVSENHPLYRTSALCGKCHQGSYREWQAAPEKGRRTCQDCHMQRVTRTATQATDMLSTLLVGFEKKFAGRRHTFGLRAVDRFEHTLEVSMRDTRRDPEGVRFTLAIKDLLPHAIPTGDFGYRFVRLTVAGRDATGGLLARRTRDLYRPLDQALLPGSIARFAFTLPPGTVSVHFEAVFAKRNGQKALLHEQTWRVS